MTLTSRPTPVGHRGSGLSPVDRSLALSAATCEAASLPMPTPARYPVPSAPTGSLPALVTPLTTPHELDLDGLVALVRRALDDGATGVLVAGTTGEGTLLEPEQRVALTRAAVAAADGATVIAGASGPTIDAVRDDVARLAGAGADLVLVLPPAIQSLRPEELADAHLAVADTAHVPVLVYHFPQLTKSSLTPEAVRELAQHDAIVGMKDSSDDAGRRAAFVTAGGDGFGVLTGHAPSLQAALEAGAVGSITAIANVKQRQVTALHAAVAAGDLVEAARRQEQLTAVSAGLGAVGASMPAALKAALQLDGVLTERWCRPPLRSVPPPALDKVRTALLR
jgi:4-hydroxy-tetrahydrodipicolinate synthase